MDEWVDVVVIGAGVSGLRAAQDLHQQGKRVVVVEAREWTGGRTRRVPAFGGKLEVNQGARFIHGDQSVLSELFERHGWGVAPVGEFPSHVSLGKGKAEQGPERVMDREGAGKSPEFARALELLYRLADDSGDAKPALPETDVSVAEWLRANEVGEDAIGILQALFTAYEFGCDAGSCGVLESHLSEASWAHGDVCFKPAKEGFRPLVRHLSAGLDVRLAHVVESVCADDSFVSVVCKGGKMFHAKGVVVSVPLPILRDGDIAFTPPLAKERVDALHKIGTGNAIQLHMHFKPNIWPEHVHTLSCPFQFLMELDVDTPIGEHRNPDECVVVAFVCGSRADEALAMPRHELEARCLEQLDALFDNAATPAFQALSLCDWNSDPFAKCSYTYGTIGAKGLRERLAEPHADGRVVFCGEATSLEVNVSLQGAMATGSRAAGQLACFV